MTKTETKKLEKGALTKFIHSKLGAKWYSENNIISYKESEKPDFIFKTSDNKNIGLEITQFFCEHKNLSYSQALTRIGNKICNIAEKKYDIKISILIDQYNERKFSAKWKDHLDYAYNPGYENIPPLKLFKEKLEDLLIENISNLKKNSFVQEWIEIKEDYYKISINIYPSILSGQFDCHVNNAGKIKFNPFIELQNCINNKNKKVKEYCKNLDKIFLLIFVPDSRNGNFCTFTNEIKTQEFIINFNSVFLYDEYKNNYYELCAK